MKLSRSLFTWLFIFWYPCVLFAQESYELSTDSKPQEGVPKGEIKGSFPFKSNIFPGTEREYWLYVPKQYDPSKPACVMIVQDGLSCAQGWNLPTVLDNLIAKKEIPVMIGIFVRWGQTPGIGNDAYPRFNRSFEYDGLGDRYARFLIEELLPEVSKSYNLSSNPDDRCIAGASSGAVCAFNAAWERPDAFRRVFSSIGTYVGLRGGDEFPTLVRKSEPKPIRVFLQDGKSDLNIYAGDWYTANLNMLSALEYAGYEVNHIWGEGGHNSKHAAAIMPEALRWLWKEYPKPVTTHKNIQVDRRIDLLIEGEGWQPISLNGHEVFQFAVNESGELFFADNKTGIVYRRNTTGNISTFVSLKGPVAAMMFGPDQKLYALSKAQKTILAITAEAKTEVLAKNVEGTSLLVSRKGIYFTETSTDRIGFYVFASRKMSYFTGIKKPIGLALTAEQTFLNVGSEQEVFGYSFKVQEEGTLAFGQPYIHYHIPYGQGVAGIRNMSVDAENLLYTTTDMGIQVSDQLGRVNFIFEKPAHALHTDVKFAGKNSAVLMVACEGKLYQRKIKAKGVLPWQEPVKPPKPGL